MTGKSNDDKKWSGLKAIQEIQQKGVGTWICRGQERKREKEPQLTLRFLERALKSDYKGLYLDSVTYYYLCNLVNSGLNFL